MHKPNLTRKELAEALADKLGYSLNTCALLIDSFLNTMKDAMLKGELVKIVRFGTFTVRQKAQRQGQNPHTGEIITIKRRQTIGFRASTKLKKRINS